MTTGWTCRIALLGLLLAGCLVRAGAPFTAYTQLPVAPHMHSHYSDGAHWVGDVVAMAEGAGYRGIIMTDHDDIYWQYPSRFGLIGHYRNSLRETGFPQYLLACRRAQQSHPAMTVLAGFEASPYYFWSGSLSRGDRLVNHQWQKHLVVVGVTDPEKYRKLPILAYGTSSFRPGKTDAGEAPYIEFTRAVEAAGGLAFWAHPFTDGFAPIWGKVYAQVTPYVHSLLDVPTSAGMAVRGTDDELTKPGGILDQAIAAFCAGTRPLMPRVMVELDYHSGPFVAFRTLAALIPHDLTIPARQAALLDALRTGRYYVTNTAPGALTLTDCNLRDDARGTLALPGETLAGTGPATLSFAVAGKVPVARVRVIRNGAVVFTGATATGGWTDAETPPAGAKWAYRLVVNCAPDRFILTNPIFRTAAL